MFKRVLDIDNISKYLVPSTFLFLSPLAKANSQQIGIEIASIGGGCTALGACGDRLIGAGGNGGAFYGILSLSPALGENTPYSLGFRFVSDTAPIDITKGGANRSDAALFFEYAQSSSLSWYGGLDWRVVQAEKPDESRSFVHQHVALEGGVVFRKTFWKHLSVGIDPLRIHIPVVTLVDKNVADYSADVQNAVQEYKDNRLSLAVFSLAYAW